MKPGASGPRPGSSPFTRANSSTCVPPHKSVSHAGTMFRLVALALALMPNVAAVGVPTDAAAEPGAERAVRTSGYTTNLVRPAPALPPSVLRRAGEEAHARFDRSTRSPTACRTTTSTSSAACSSSWTRAARRSVKGSLGARRHERRSPYALPRRRLREEPELVSSTPLPCDARRGGSASGEVLGDALEKRTEPESSREIPPKTQHARRGPQGDPAPAGRATQASAGRRGRRGGPRALVHGDVRAHDRDVRADDHHARPGVLSHALGARRHA